MSIRIRNLHEAESLFTSVADPGCLLRIQDVYPGSEFFHPGYRIQGEKIPDLGSRIRIKELSIFNPKTCF
jgi:hypothetical protein